jgi:hypothetical protein
MTRLVEEKLTEIHMVFLPSRLSSEVRHCLAEESFVLPFSSHQL